MILVNITRSYPVEQIAEATVDTNHDPSPDPVKWALAFNALRNAASGDWPYLSTDYLTKNGGYVAATTTRGHIVGIFRLADADWLVDEQGHQKVRFTLEPAPEASHHIGGPMPGGPWKQGEARGTRAVPTPTDLLPTDGLTPTDIDAYYLRTHHAALVHNGNARAGSLPAKGPRPYSHADTSWTDRGVVGGADVRAYPDGVIHVYAPAGARVIVESGN